MERLIINVVQVLMTFTGNSENNETLEDRMMHSGVGHDKIHTIP
jgi:hypothetical protein